MSFTRFHDDPARIIKGLEESTFIGRYQLDTPGPGVDLPYMADPQLRIQRWGANMASDTTNLESDLFCLGRPLSHDYDRTYLQSPLFHGQTPVYSIHKEHVFESRATHPAWTYRDLEQPRWETPFLNPLTHLEKVFPENISTRILTKDQFVPSLPSVPSSAENHLVGNVDFRPTPSRK